MKKALIITGLFLIIILLLEFMPNLKGEFIMTDKLYINEIVASNYSILKDDDGDYSDYIEIYNGYKYDINLHNYYLSDEEYNVRKWSFPAIEIKSKEYLIIYASGKDKCDLETRTCHTNFKLSSEGETLTLIDDMGNIISKISYPTMGPDESYGYLNRRYMLFESGTPAKENTSEKLEQSTNNTYQSITINEYMTKNKRSHYDNHGNYYDWVELYNSSKEDVTLKNIFISDDASNLNKYKIKEITIPKEGYLLIYMPGEKVNYTDAIYTNFALSENDNKIILSDGKKIIDEVKIVKLGTDISYGKKDDNWKYFTSPTPGYENNTASFDNIGGVSNGNT